jgi:hypothetical protein
VRKVLAISLLMGGIASSAPFITVIPTLGPDFGLSSSSPNFNAWAQNVVNTLIIGSQQGPVSTSDPQNYTALSNGANLTGAEFIATPFNSWKGTASPGGLLTSEFGTALYFSLQILGNVDNQFTLNQLAAQETYLGVPQPAYVAGDFGDGANTGVFETYLVGQRAAGGFTVGNIDTGNTPLVGLWYVGVGFVQGLDPLAIGTDQQKINATVAEVQALANRTTNVCYSLGATQSCAGVNVQGAPPSSVPEPGTFVLLGAGLAGFAFLRRRSA